MLFKHGMDYSIVNDKKAILFTNRAEQKFRLINLQKANYADFITKNTNKIKITCDTISGDFKLSREDCNEPEGKNETCKSGKKG